MVNYFNFVVTCLISLCVTNVTNVRDYVHFGKKVELQSGGLVVDAIQSHHLESDVSSCVYECKLRPNCRFINYHRLLLQCFLIRVVQVTETVNILNSPGYVYGDKNDWDVTSICSGCATGETCVPAYGVWQCNIKECGSPPTFLDSVVNGNMRSVGSMVTYTCTQYKSMIVHTTSSSECLKTGLWSETNFECLDVDECLSDPCLNSGTCVDGVNEYTCSCESGWGGTHCEIDINECQSTPCLNGGTCTDVVNGYTCACTYEWNGPTCESVNECASDPCINGGTCSEGENTFSCACADGWSGNSCEKNVDECLSDPCLNSGTCVDGVNEYTCSCESGWGGTHCERDVDECMSDPCLNSGTCVDGVNKYTCSCKNGWTGTHCETDIDECASSPCQNGGQCIDGLNQYTCSCTSSWTGDHCQTGQCDSGWSLYMTSCYKLNSYKKPFSQAKDVCQQQSGGHLADVTSATEMDFLKNLYLSSHSQSAIDGVWVSANDIANEGVWRLSDNTVASFMNWHLPGQPDGEFSYDDCTQVWPNVNFYWNDVDCSFSYWFYCEYEL